MESEALERLLKELAGGGIVVASAWCLGGTVLGRIPAAAAKLTWLELAGFSLGLGSALLSQIILALGLLGLIYDLTFVLLALACLAAYWFWGRGIETAPSEESSRFWPWAAACTAVFYVPLNLSTALAPDAGSDSLGYHLGLVFRYYREHAVVPVTSSVYGFLSQGVEMLYLMAFAFGRHDAPKLVHFSFYLATLALMVALGKRLGTPSAGWIGAILFGCAPVVAYDAALAYNDVALAFFGLLVFYGLVVWPDRPALVGSLAGFCFSIKLTGAIAIVAAGAVILRRSWRQALVFGGVAALFVAPWVVRNTLIAGNPVAPMYNRIFPNPYVGVDWEENWRSFLVHYKYPADRKGLRDYLDRPWEVAVDGRRFGGIVGPVFLLAPIALLGWRRRGFAALAAATALALLPWLSNAGTRFVIPGLVFISLLMGLGIAALGLRWSRELGIALVVAHAITVWPGKVESGVWGVDRQAWPVLLGEEPKDAYVQRHLPGFTVARAMAKFTPPGSRALVFCQIADAYFPGEVVPADFGIEGNDLFRDLLMALEDDPSPERRVHFSWPRQLLSAVRVEQTAYYPEMPWQIAEILLPDGLEATVETSVYPWTAHRLLDGDIFSIWRSNRPLEPGWFEIRFDEPVEIEGFEMITPLGEHYPQYELPGLEHGIAFERKPISLELRRAAAHRSLREADIALLGGELSDGGLGPILRRIVEEAEPLGLELVWSEGGWVVLRVLPAVQPSGVSAHPIQ